MNRKKARIETLRERNIKESRASMRMSKLAEVVIDMLDSLDSVVLLSLRLRKETSKGEKSLVVAVLMRT